jgi:uncharacterized membrane protein (DUF2068 family)
MEGRHNSGVRSIAVFEASKGLVVMLAGLGLFAVIHHGIGDAAEDIVGFFHLNPARRYPRIFLETFDRLNSFQMWMLSFSALMYSSLRFIEAYGLWQGKAWAEWLAAGSGALYLPMELYEIAEKMSPARLSVFLLNVVLVAYLFYVIADRKKRSVKGEKASSA